MNNQEIIQIAEKSFDDSFYIFDKEKLRENYDSMKESFCSRYSNFIIGYSYKTNYMPALLKEMAKLGAYAEVVSRLEYDLAIKVGEKSSRIIFNGPLKSYEDIAIALDGNTIINLDSFNEVEIVKAYASKNTKKQVKVGLRVSFDLGEDGNNPLQSGFEYSRFGFCTENGNLEMAISRLKNLPNVTVVGLHGHFSTTTRSLTVYKLITQTLCDLAKKHLADTLEYIDIGGGFYGYVPATMNVIDAPSFEMYAEAICSIMNKEKNNFNKEPLLIIEPGLSLVVDTFKFYSRVMDVKRSRDKYFVLVNGSIHNVKPTKHSFNLPMDHVMKSDEDYEYGKFNVVGYTCMEKDYLAIDIESKLPKRGDFLVFSNVGAYTIVFDPPFIKERPPIISKDGEEFEVARRKEKLGDFINDDVYVF